MTGARAPTWRRRLVLAAFWCYAAALILTARHLAHAWWNGWSARVIGMALVAAGLLPWLPWLRPRVAAWLGVLGRVILALCYLVVLAPFALLARFGGDPLRRRHAPGTSRWIPRRPLPTALDASRLEY